MGSFPCRILLITGASTASTRESAASFFNSSVLIKASSNLFGS